MSLSFVDSRPTISSIMSEDTEPDELIDQHADTGDDEEAEGIVDDAAKDDTVAVERYDITSFGADYDVEGLVKRLNRKDVLIPPFQRDYVWNQKEASRFVESLLLGLPVPGIFMAREADTNKLLVIDGQQRLKTLQFFYSGYFNPREGDRSRRVFKLANVQPQFAARTYDTLEDQDRVKLNDSIIHATIVKQESPEGDDTSIYHIFERLNYGGRRLTAQEIRVAISHGSLVDAIKSINDTNATWRSVYGLRSKRLKDQELILRFFAFYYGADSYTRPMGEFLNKFAARNKNASAELAAAASATFSAALTTLHEAVGERLFRPERSLNAAVFDSTMVGIARRLAQGPTTSADAVREAYESLLRDRTFQEVTSRSTADDKFVDRRLTMATEAFAGV
jgi:hypothetical protein